MVSHRSGETEDTFISDLVVGLCTGQVCAHTHTGLRAQSGGPVRALAPPVPVRAVVSPLKTCFSWFLLPDQDGRSLQIRAFGQIQSADEVRLPFI